jgi:FKBP-type peptidyl-prolyl cis-trans isomerase FkpA
MTKAPTARAIACVFAFLSLAACSGKAAESKPVALETEDQKTLYTLGQLIGGQIKVFALTPEELAIVQKGLADSVTGAKAAVDAQAYGPKVNELAQKRSVAGATTAKTKGKEFADAAAKEQGATVLPSGVVYKTLKPGTGASPVATDTVKVHYDGKLIDGTTFDSSVQRGEPAEFPLNGVIPCWTQGVAKMKVGEKAKLVCPSDQAYGDQGRPGIPPGATLVFEVELLDIKK